MLFFSLELDLDLCLFLSFVRDSASSLDDWRRDSDFLFSLDRDLLLDLDLDRERTRLLSLDLDLDLDLERDFERDRSLLLSLDDLLFTSSSFLSLLLFLCFFVLERSLLLELVLDLDLLSLERERLLFLDVLSGDFEGELSVSLWVLFSLDRERLEDFALPFSFRLPPCLDSSLLHFRSRSGLLGFCNFSMLLERVG